MYIYMMRPSMHTIEVFDPALCCPTGICGPSVDPELLRMSAVLDALAKAGFCVVRHSLAQQPQAFADNEEVRELLRQEGADILPLTFVDGELIAKGAYPTTELLGTTLGVIFVSDNEEGSHGCCGGDSDGGCCSGDSDSCCCGGSCC